MSYALAAVNAAKVSKEYGISPVKTWQLFMEHLFPESKSGREKGCPKSTFLGLCEAGYIEGIKPQVYTSSVHNKRYAIAAVKILSANENLNYAPSELWQLVLENETDQSRQYNHQMHVVLALWDAGLIMKQAAIKI